MINEIYIVADKKEEKFLRLKTRDFDFESTNKKSVNDLILRMKKIMRVANGIGLSANQIGLPYNMFIANVPNTKGEYKFYAVFNPKIGKIEKEKVPMEEGCLSVPGLYGEVERPERLSISGFDKNGKPIKIKAWGLLARVFQHEMDHLTGKLFIDRTKKIFRVEHNHAE